MADWAKLIEAIAGLVGAVAWPIAVVLAVWLIMRRHRDAFERLIDRVTSLSFAGGEIALAESKLDAREKEQRQRVDALEEQLAGDDAPEDTRRVILRELTSEAETLGRVSANKDLLWRIADLARNDSRHDADWWIRKLGAAPTEQEKQDAFRAALIRRLQRNETASEEQMRPQGEDV
ncbi:hypothetical protein DQ384_05570 [Sphaerisporangium album]|uniref:Uncharacterized protein n=1 Tax=Sphaerisporangium album TaxID=509200 RepID=A0A367FQP2_9ACTN|nr:hypothetical protein [Sphaerisporangium album]RCG32010.1 hypothetical protein DQ384_05570 [Sphaerisporangium album]